MIGLDTWNRPDGFPRRVKRAHYFYVVFFSPFPTLYPSPFGAHQEGCVCRQNETQKSNGFLYKYIYSVYIPN